MLQKIEEIYSNINFCGRRFSSYEIASWMLSGIYNEIHFIKS